ncbi:MAG: 2-succinyl-5-enolpyruvyl-6-hydroxy-3-cyclohexene-1-carboxylic-acid synthase [bacterium]|nr:2-succinyl-5-enolpyruvyl-6-hydroxy-3-cyclohexene-1-carboxylic-acid synthase [bacterium]
MGLGQVNRDYLGVQHAYCAVLLEEWCRLGLADVCLAPGSRSTPLVVALDALKSRYGIRVHTHIDERGLGFFALGLAKATGKPAIVITTSGTAVANLLPAVVEASQTYTPMIVVSADRPPWHIGVGANQAIVQPGLFGGYVRLEIDAEVPGSDVSLVHSVQQADQLWQTAIHPCHSGPVHLNVPFCEPLLGDRLHDSHVVFDGLSSWKDSEAPYGLPDGLAEQNRAQMDYRLSSDDATLFTRASAGLIVVGELVDGLDIEAIVQLGSQLGWPIVADPLSGCLALKHYPFIPYGDYFWRDLMDQGVSPDVVLHLGGPVVSRKLQAFMASRREALVHVDQTDRVVNPDGAVTRRIITPVRVFAAQFISLRIPAQNWLDRRLPNMGWMDDHIASFFSSKTQAPSSDAVASELSVVRELSGLVPEDGTLFVGNSLPIRELLWVGARDGKCRRILGNRGASGIDGLVSTAAGVSAGSRAPVTLLIGDMSALHDLSGWLWLARSECAVVMVVVNNGGGAIFDHLSISQEQSALVPDYYTMARDVSFVNLAKGIGVPVKLVSTVASFKTAYKSALKKATASHASMIIEVKASYSAIEIKQLAASLAQALLSKS